MCTLILGLGVLGPGSVVLGANRDESQHRPSADPGVLVSEPRVVGGRDLVSGGTWLAVREARFVAALMNRRPDPGDRRDPATLRSRGLLCLDLAARGASGSFSSFARELVKKGSYAPCTLLGVSSDEAWALRNDLRGIALVDLEPGWHVITHQEVDDPSEPRTKWLLDRMREKPGPQSPDEAFDRMIRHLRSHGEQGAPPVCLHREVFPTVSSSLIAFGPTIEQRYLHAPGPPCVTEYQDCTKLLLSEVGP